MIRTSHSHPLNIASLRVTGDAGLVGITFCPGKQQQNAMSGTWMRDLSIDLDAVCAWNAAALVTLLEDHELGRLSVSNLGDEVRRRHIDWYHLPIRDVSTPNADFERAWQQVGPQLLARIRSGCNVLVHCKGGLGRAGTVAARLLVELGTEPAQAIRQVREVRPGAIETAAQERYVLGLPRQLPRPDASVAATRDRAVGAMLGLAVGDAIGTTLEFTPRDSLPLLTGMVGAGPFRLAPGEWTDDTAMALALTDSLLSHPDLDETDLMDRFVAWHERGDYSHNGRCFDIGITTLGALGRFVKSGEPIAGSSDPGTAGNGSLMRLAPVAVRYWNDPGRLRDTAARQSRTTHGAAEAVDACVAYAELLADAIAGRPAEEVLFPRSGDWAPKIAVIMAGGWRTKQRGDIRGSGYVVDALEAALWSVAHAGGDAARAVLTAANLGDDADTTAAIAGQLAGALSGTDGIPADWLQCLAWRGRIANMAGALFDQSLEGKSWL
jgi:ADP-ribosyl-[dinitrogen reductase] hydrolase